MIILRHPIPRDQKSAPVVVVWGLEWMAVVVPDDESREPAR
jgi:hypothetical protein